MAHYNVFICIEGRNLNEMVYYRAIKQWPL